MHFKTTLHCVSGFLKAKKHSVWTAFIQLTGFHSVWTPDLKTLNLPQPVSAYNYHGQTTSRQTAFLNERLSQMLLHPHWTAGKTTIAREKSPPVFKKIIDIHDLNWRYTIRIEMLIKSGYTVCVLCIQAGAPLHTNTQGLPQPIAHPSIDCLCGCRVHYWFVLIRFKWTIITLSSRQQVNVTV